jgi:2-methylcitrate dehydratase PrpD
VRRADMQAFFPKVKLKPVDEYDPRDPVFSLTERVVIKLKNGEVLDTGPVGNTSGHATDPMSAEELWVKFAECTARTHTEPEARRLFKLLQAIETLPSLRELPTCETIFTA